MNIAPELPRPMPFDWIIAIPGRIRAFARRFVGLRAAHAQTNRLTDRMLRDIGVTRHEMPLASLAPTPHDALYMMSLMTPRRRGGTG